MAFGGVPLGSHDFWVPKPPILKEDSPPGLGCVNTVESDLDFTMVKYSM